MKTADVLADSFGRVHYEVHQCLDGLAPGELHVTRGAVYAGTGSRPVLLGDVQRVTDQSGDLAVIQHWLSRAVHHPFSFFGMIDPVPDVASHAFAKHFVDRFC